MSTSRKKELLFWILQFLAEEKFEETAHKLEKESGIFFNMKYFDDLVTNGQWEEVEKYLSGFTKVNDNYRSKSIFMKIRVQKYLEALDRNEKSEAVEILMKDLKVFSEDHEDMFSKWTVLLTLGNFREDEKWSTYGDIESERAEMMRWLRIYIENNPLFQDKLNFPSFESSRLRTVIDHSLNSELQICKNSLPVIDPLADSMPRPFQPAPTGLLAALTGKMANPFSVPHPDAPVGPSHPIGLSAPSKAASMVKHPGTATDNPAVDDQNVSLLDLVMRIENGGDNRSMTDWRLTEINDPSQLRALLLVNYVISRLMYTTSGDGLVAYQDVDDRLFDWKWETNDHNLTGKATSSVAPKSRMWGVKNRKGFPTNPCIALSKDAGYVIFNKMGALYLFDKRTIKTLFIDRPMACSLAFHPEDDNILAIGMDDSTMLIYNVKDAKVESTLKGHQNKVTGLAFSNVLKVLVSSGADSQLCVWRTDIWEKQANTFLDMRGPTGEA